MHQVIDSLHCAGSRGKHKHLQARKLLTPLAGSWEPNHCTWRRGTLRPAPHPEPELSSACTAIFACCRRASSSKSSCTQTATSVHCVLPALPVPMNSPPGTLAGASAAAHQRAAVPASSPVLLQTAGELFRALDATRIVFRGVPLDAGGLASPPAPAAQPRSAPAATAETLGSQERGLLTAQGNGAQALAHDPGMSPAAAGRAQLHAACASADAPGLQALLGAREHVMSPAAAAQSWRGGSIFGPSPPGSPLPVLTLLSPPASLGLGRASGQGPASGQGLGQGPSPVSAHAPAAVRGSAFQPFLRPQMAPGAAQPCIPAQAPSARAWTGSTLVGSGRAQANSGAAQVWWPQQGPAGAAALDTTQFYGGRSDGAARGGPSGGRGQALGAAQAYPAVSVTGARLLQGALRAGGSARAALQGLSQGLAAGSRGAPAALHSVPVDSGSIGGRGSGTESSMSQVGPLPA